MKVSALEHPYRKEFTFSGKLTRQQIIEIRNIKRRTVYHKCDTCIVKDVLRVLGCRLSEGDCCGGPFKFQKFFPECPTRCPITQETANYFVGAVYFLKSQRAARI